VVSSSARAYLADQWKADQGYIVVRLDGRGTPFRGRDWERAVRGNLIDVALEDQVAACAPLAGSIPSSISRASGSRLVVRRLLQRDGHHPPARCLSLRRRRRARHHVGKLRHLSTPSATSACRRRTAPAYQVSSVLTYAKQLERPLLLIHGLTDDNVYAQHTLQLADALFMAGKPYEFLPMLGTHLAGSSDPVVQLREEMRVIEFFNRELKP
jgi:dipeptidyl-peptidase-4